jgi:hypothetical protein
LRDRFSHRMANLSDRLVVYIEARIRHVFGLLYCILYPDWQSRHLFYGSLDNAHNIPAEMWRTNPRCSSNCASNNLYIQLPEDLNRPSMDRKLWGLDSLDFIDLKANTTILIFYQHEIWGVGDSKSSCHGIAHQPIFFRTQQIP